MGCVLSCVWRIGLGNNVEWCWVDVAFGAALAVLDRACMYTAVSGRRVTPKKTVKSNAPAKWDEDELRYIHQMKRFCVCSIRACRAEDRSNVHP